MYMYDIVYNIYIYIYYIHENNGMVMDANNIKQRIVAWSITTDIYRPSKAQLPAKDGATVLIWGASYQRCLIVCEIPPCMI